MCHISIHVLKIQKNTLLNIVWVFIVVTSLTTYPQEYITLHKQCMSYIHPSTKDLKEYDEFYISVKTDIFDCQKKKDAKGIILVKNPTTDEEIRLGSLCCACRIKRVVYYRHFTN